MKQFVNFTAVVAIMVLALAGLALAVSPQLVNYQGRLVDGSGDPENGTFGMTFSIYSVETGGTALWTETQSVTVTDGFFDVLVGSITALGEDVFTGEERWLGLQIGADPELARSRLVTTPYSFRTNTADSAATVSDGAVTGSKILDGTIQLVDIGQNGAASGEVLKWDGSAWAPASDETSTGGSGDIDGVTAGTGLSGGGTSGTVTLNIANGGVGTTQLADESVTESKLDATNAGTTGQVLTKSATSGRFTWADDQTGSGGGGGWTDDGANVRLETVGDKVGIGLTGPSAKLHVLTSSGDGIYGVSTDAAGTGVTGVGNFVGVQGLANADAAAAVHGLVASKNNAKAIHGQVMGGSGNYAGYFDGNVKMDGFEMPTGASNGYVLTSDGSGVGTWQTGGGGADGDWTIFGSDMYSAVSGNVGIGTSAPYNSKLNVLNSASGDQTGVTINISSTDAFVKNGLTIQANSPTGDVDGVEIYAGSTAGSGWRRGVYASASAGTSGTCIGVQGQAYAAGGTANLYGVFGEVMGTTSGNAYAGYFDGDLVTGNGTDLYTEASTAGGGGTFTTFGANGERNVRLSSLGSNSDYGYVAVMDDAANNRAGMYVNTGDYGVVETFGPNGNSNTALSAVSGSLDHGYISVRNSDGNTRAGLYCDGGGDGYAEAAHCYVPVLRWYMQTGVSSASGTVTQTQQPR